ncbi:MAG: S8 family serine peptidase, partial [Bacteroidota bacterium]
IDGITGTVDIDIDAPEAWAVSLGSNTITVAVLDEGVAPHEDLEDGMGMSRVLPGYDVVNPGVGDGAPIAAGEAHGQSCAGLIAASHNAIGTRGVAPNVNILPIYATFSVATPVSQIADGINWAWNNGADIISNSWVYYLCMANPFPVLNTAIDSATTYGRGGQGCVVTFAAGNISACVGFPANKSNTLAMGAVTNQGNQAGYSNFGPELDLVAPSSGSSSNMRTVDRMGMQGYNTTGTGDLPNVNYTRNFGGTSSATALSSGAAAILLSEFSYLSELQIRDLLRNSATDMGPAGFDNNFGHGRLSVGDALQLAFNTYFLAPQSELPSPTLAVVQDTYVFRDEWGNLMLHAGKEWEGPVSAEGVDLQGRIVGNHSNIPPLSPFPLAAFSEMNTAIFLRLRDQNGRTRTFRIPPQN